jgi:hypothetical protein
MNERYVRPDVLVRIVGSAGSDPPPGPTPSAPTAKPAAEVTVEQSPSGRPATPRLIDRDERLTLDRFLNTERRAVIVGDAGAGKSTLLRFLALDILAEGPELTSVREQYSGYLPVWVPFALWARMAVDRGAPPALEDVVVAFFRAQNEPALAEDMRRALAGLRVFLLVDGLDEAVDSTAATTLASNLFAFAERHDLPVLATTRPHGVRGNWLRAELAPLSDAQQHALATIWFRLLEAYETEGQRVDGSQIDTHAAQRANHFVTALQRSSGIARFAQTPLFFLALIGLYRQGHELPRSRFAASREIVQQLVEHQPNRRTADSMVISSPAVDRKLRDRLISDFAYALHAGELLGAVTDAALEDDAIARATRVVLERQGRGDIEQAERHARSIFQFSEERAGLLVKKAHHELGFLHLSLQEYLTACHLVQWSLHEKVEFIRLHAEQPRWREPILYLLFLTNSEHDVGELLAAIANVPAASARGGAMQAALLADAVFADFSHNPSIAHDLATKLFVEAETTAWGDRQRHLATAVVEGLSSETMDRQCATKIAEWIPDRHAFGRAAVLRAMPAWHVSLRPACLSVALRSLHAETDHVWRPAGEAVASLSDRSGEAKSALQQLAKQPSSVDVLQAALWALGCGWADNVDVMEMARASRSSAHAGICLEAMRVRARGNETDLDDLTRFCAISFDQEHFWDGVFAPDLVEHFARTHREAFTRFLEEAIGDRHGDRLHRLTPLVGCLLYCDPKHPLAEETLLELFTTDWTWHELFYRSDFPVDRINWTPDLLAHIDRHIARKDSFDAFEGYHIAKVAPQNSLKKKFIETLAQKEHKDFWAATALVEIWGKGDADVCRVGLHPVWMTPA